MNFEQYWETASEWMLTTGAQLLLILVLALIAVRLIRVSLKKAFGAVSRGQETIESKKRTETVQSVIRHTLNVVIFGVVLMMILDKLGIDIGPILAAAGVVGLAVGFGAQDLVRDVVSGFFIIVEDQIRVGDVVQLGDKGGLVEKVNLRMTVLRDLEGNVHYVTNGSIGVVTNKTKEYSRYVFDIGVAYREDVDEVIEIMKKVDEELRQDPKFSTNILEPLEVLGLNEFGDSALVVRGRTKTTPGSQWGVGREFNRRLKKVFDAENIEIPFPHVTVYMGQDKKGEAPPLFLAGQAAKKVKKPARRSRRGR
ncbi:MAG: mechanosensitive ion channel family protein [Bacteroidota bacterium]